MKASYDFTPDDMAAFAQFHNARSPALREQRLGYFLIGFLAMCILPAFVLSMSGRPLLQTAIDIWPLLLGPVLYSVLYVLFRSSFTFTFTFTFAKWMSSSLRKRLMKDGRNTGFYGVCTLSLETDGIHETKSNGRSIRNWSAVEQIVITSQHLFVYISDVEAFVVPRRAFESDSDFNSFAQQIAERSHAKVLRA